VKRRTYLSTVAIIGIAGCSGDSQNTSSPSNTDAGGSGGNTTSDNSDLKQQVLDKYNQAVGTTNKGISDLNSSINNYNNRNYSTSKNQAANAAGHFDKAESRYSNAHSLSLQIDNSSAQQICSNAVDYAVLLEQASTQAKRAASDAMNGNMDQSNSHAQEHQSLWTEAKQEDPKDPSVLKNTLGL